MDLPRAGWPSGCWYALAWPGTPPGCWPRPRLRGSWPLAVAAVLAFAVLAGWTHPGQDANLAFLCVAPLLPLAGIAAAYGLGVDPTYEIGLAAPLGSFRPLLLRAAAVLGTATLLAAAASLKLPRLGPGAAGWLLPSLGLTASSLALATTVTRALDRDRRRLDPGGRGHRVAAGAVVGPVRPGRAGRLCGLGAARRRRAAGSPRPLRVRPRLRHHPRFAARRLR